MVSEGGPATPTLLRGSFLAVILTRFAVKFFEGEGMVWFSAFMRFGPEREREREMAVLLKRGLRMYNCGAWGVWRG